MYGNNRGNRGGFGGPRFAPVNVGEELDVSIEAVGDKGDGVCKKKGFVIFVPNTKEGDHVRIKITKVLRKVAFAEVIGEAQGEPETDDVVPPPEKEEAPADSEDFGEESEDDSMDEDPEEESEDFGEEDSADEDEMDEEAEDEPEEDSAEEEPESDEEADEEEPEEKKKTED